MKLKLLALYLIIQAISGFRIFDSKLSEKNKLSTKIIGGNGAQDGAAPYQCQIITDGRFWCACAIISEKWVVSSAQCFNSTKLPTPFHVRVGSNEIHSGFAYLIARIIRHENRGNFEESFRNDIAVINVRGSFKFTNEIQPIELATEEVPEGTTLTVTGWGITRRGDYDKPDELQILNVTAISTSKCKEELQDYYDDSILCISTKNDKGTCTYDSGDPLVYNNKLYGISSFAYGNCASGQPDGYAKISHLHDWIKTQIKNN